MAAVADDSTAKEAKKDDEQMNDEPEPMELDDEEENTNTIIEVNHPTKPAEAPATAADEELLVKAKLQLDYLKQMEKEQEKLVAEQQGATPPI